MAAEQLMEEIKVIYAQLNLAIIHLAAHSQHIPTFLDKICMLLQQSGIH